LDSINAGVLMVGEKAPDLVRSRIMADAERSTPVDPQNTAGSSW
jgi:hypothetical protein